MQALRLMFLGLKFCVAVVLSTDRYGFCVIQGAKQHLAVLGKLLSGFQAMINIQGHLKCNKHVIIFGLGSVLVSKSAPGGLTPLPEKPNMI